MKKKLLITLCLLVLVCISSVSIAAPVGQDYAQANKLFSKKEYAQALLIYQALLSDPDCNISTSVLRVRIADTYFRLEDYRNALSEYRIALQEQKVSERPSTQYWIAFCTMLLGRDAEAVNEFLKIPQLYPEAEMWGSTAYYWAGRACERSGKKEQAAEYFRKAAAGSGKSTQGKFALKKAEKVK
jgi:tetratricopeptide (TPR) repeat protein